MIGSGTSIWNKYSSIGMDVLMDVVGSFLFAVGVQCFSAPNNIAPGGVSGLSILINYLTGFPISATSFLFNVPLLLMAWFILGRRFTLRTLKTVVIMTLCLAVSERILPAYQGEMILVALCGGVLEGIGLGLVFTRGSSTGGTDVAARLLQIRVPHISIGRIMLVVDGLVLLASAFVYQAVENALYGLIFIFTSTRLIDSILYGLDTGRVMMILSNDHEEIAKTVNRQMERGCTLLQGKGTYTGKDRPVLLCAVRKPEFTTLKRIVYAIDPDAFVMVLEADEIVGEGFKNPEANTK